MNKSLDRKLAAIHADPGCREFIIADAKDADMALGIGAPGQSPEMHSGEVRFRTLEEYREQMRLITRSGLVDIMLMSASSNYALDVSRAALRRFARHAGRPRQRHHRHPPGPGRGYHAAAFAAVPHREHRSHSVRPYRLRSGGTQRKGRTWGSTASRSTTTSSATWRRSSGSTSFAKKPSARAFATSSRSSTPTSRAPSSAELLPGYSTT